MKLLVREKEIFNIKDSLKSILLSVIFGMLLGLVSKILDSIPSNTYPFLLETLDLGNFFSKMGIWLFISMILSIYSRGPLESVLKVFLFFISMICSYYLYTILVLGFTPIQEIKIWFFMSLLSIPIAYITYYAKGTHPISNILSILIMVVMSRQAFAAGFFYFDVRDALELLLWILSLWVLYETPKQISFVTIISIVIFFLTANIPIINGIL